MKRMSKQAVPVLNFESCTHVKCISRAPHKAHPSNGPIKGLRKGAVYNVTGYNLSPAGHPVVQVRDIFGNKRWYSTSRFKIER